MPLHDIEVIRKIDTGHRVVGHSGKCKFLHGHTYTIVAKLGSHDLNELGMVADFGLVKEIIDRWDHKMVLWREDPYVVKYKDKIMEEIDAHVGIVRVPFNPTAENMAKHLAEELSSLPDVVWATVYVSETDSTTASFSVQNDY